MSENSDIGSRQITVQKSDKVAEEESPPDYEFTLRIENIRLKSRLEQANEKTSAMERERDVIMVELQKEKQKVLKVNANMIKLMNEKKRLEEELKNKSVSLHHHPDIKGVVQKFEEDICALEERLETQRQNYDKEHVEINNELKDERRICQEWKNNYLKSQVAMMAFRRKLDNMKDSIPESDRKELSKCLEVVMESEPSFLAKKKIEKIPASSATRSSPPTINNPMVLLDQLKSLNEEKSDSEQPKVFIINDKNLLVEANKTVAEPTPPFPAETNLLKPIAPKLPATTTSLLANGLLIPQVSQTISNKDSIPKFNIILTPFTQKGNITIKSDLLPTTAAKLVIPSANIQNALSKQRSNKLINLNTTIGGLNFKKTIENKAPEVKASTLKVFHTTAFSSPPTMVGGSAISAPQPASNIKVERGALLPSVRKWCLTCDLEVTEESCGHTDIVVQKNAKEFPCPTCNRIFNNRSHLKRHNMIHSGEKPWACDFCDKRFNRKSHLSRHVLTHTGEKPFKCDRCTKAFADNSDLKRHKATHLADDAFTPMTSASAISPTSIPTAASVSHVPIKPIDQPEPSITNTGTSDNFLSNVQNISTGKFTVPQNKLPIAAITVKKSFALPKQIEALRFPCQICGKAFTRRSHLTRHQLTHNRAGPEDVYCDCGRLFKQRSHMLAHQPSCKRKRDAVEAKYLATVTQPRDNSMVSVKDEPMLIDEELKIEVDEDVTLIEDNNNLSISEGAGFDNSSGNVEAVKIAA